MRPRPIVWGALGLAWSQLMLTAGCARPVASPPPVPVPVPAHERRTVHDGVFSRAQADRGQVSYEAHCQSCHGADLEGGNARALVGESFLRNWTGLPLDGLFGQLESMPPAAASSLGEPTYLDILGYVLATNGFPAGTNDLRTEVLASVVLEGIDGPQEVPDHALVQVVGCLIRGAADNWILTGASDPIRTRDPEASASSDRDPEAAGRARGGAGVRRRSRSFVLLYVFPDPAGQEGHRVEVKGFLIRGDQDAVNVTALASLSPRCSRD